MLFDELRIRELTLRNRIVVSPMCQYSSEDGFATDWHLVHLGSRAVGGASLVFTEATAVSAEGRISPQDLGIYKDDHIEQLSRITRFLREQGSIPGIQLAHAGRKGSTLRPSEGNRAIPESKGGWKPVAPSAVPFSETYPNPTALDENGIRGVVKSFANAARRALEAGFQVIEIHSAHGYLCEVVTAVRGIWPAGYPLFVRISATDWIEGGWDVDQSVELAKKIGPLGVDLIDCSSGGIAPGAKIPIKAGYQVPFAREIRYETKIMTGAVGLITSANQADTILREENADIVLLAREFLRQPYWPLQTARDLGFAVPWPVQYLRAAPDGTPTREPIRPPEGMDAFAEHGANLK